MSSNLKVNNIQNLAGDDSGIDLSTNDQIILKTANTTAVTVDSSQNTTFTGEIITSTSGTSNVRIGENAGDAIASGGTQNTVVGDDAGTAITTGDNNVAVGYQALYVSTTASDNTAFGTFAGHDITTGTKNVLVGKNSGPVLTTGTKNTFIGADAGEQVTTGSNNTILGRYNGNGGGLDIRTSDNNIVLSDGDGNPRLRIDANGDLLIGNSVSASNGVLSVNHSSKGTSDVLARFLGNASKSLLIRGDGDAENTNNSYGGISDVTLKENIAHANSQWNDIKALQVRNYSMIADNLDSANKIGVIAQELETAGMNGLVSEDNDGLKSVKYSILYMKAVKALQEAMTRIETLETENQTQATQIADLISRVTALESE